MQLRASRNITAFLFPFRFRARGDRLHSHTNILKESTRRSGDTASVSAGLAPPQLRSPSHAYRTSMLLLEAT
ncbi:hypothetical protein BU26DRAFT_203148 [Trematosphaeria pertusa]|uniref:Uncharacterized protein n=1 Tax=Trematosphaeria pertusa TaxID=390896 RepID=A0A6A6HRH1_9PLEO|nr:uncharacterized protein BU26DRAFT_203148 [Trematosphaeria pertusa]KAF2240611.1 hypothetical protein BU26DRAFT_203148 [Trematosphaeria pertusa]